MKLTKFQHACVVLEKDGSTLIIDPGTYSRDFITPHRVDAIIITHEHPDHFDEKRIQQILTTHPKATVIAHESISGRFTNYTTVGAKVNEKYTIGAFSVEFFGGEHATISASIPVPPNLGVLIDNSTLVTRLLFPKLLPPNLCTCKRSLYQPAHRGLK